jgi:hypothetical protein
MACVNQKERAFIDKYYKKDLQFLKTARQELLQ